MKRILLFLLLLTSIVIPQSLKLQNTVVSTVFNGIPPFWYAHGFNGADQYFYDSSVYGLDLNGSEMITNSYDRDMTALLEDYMITGTWNTASGIVYDDVNDEYDITNNSSTNFYKATTFNTSYYYRVTFTIKNYVGGTIYYKVKEGLLSNPITANGSYSFYFTKGGTTYNYAAFTTATFTGSVDDVIITPTNWTGASFVNNAMTFTTTASLTTDYYTDMVVGHNYTLQADMKSGASSSFKFVTDNDSSTVTTTTTSATKAFTFTYSGGSQTIQLKGVGSDTWTADNISITESYDVEIEGYFKANNIATTQYLLATSAGNNMRLAIVTNSLFFRVDQSQGSGNIYSAFLQSNT